MAQLLSGPSLLRLKKGRQVPLRVRVNPRARRILISVSPHFAGIELVLPRPGLLAEGLAFVTERGDWIAASLDELPAPVPFQEGVEIPFLGQSLTIRCRPGEAGFILPTDDFLEIDGPAETLPERIGLWLRQQAEREIRVRAQAGVVQLGASYRRIIVSDTKSRWGSCSYEGDLRFSWRLIFAPEMVLDYVVAHEVAHLREMNHGRNFWALVKTLVGEFRPAQEWLRKNGPALYRYGQCEPELP